ncbi:Uncharacterised protein at_DN1833 [Pycnogonum litorale]
MMQQSEIMSAHWDHGTTTVFTAVISTQTGSQSYAIISDELCHDKFAVAAFNRQILAHAVSSGMNVQTIHFFSDGAAGQFKNRFTLSSLLKPELLHPDVHKADWNFFATAHGKGPVDGVGGTVKRAVWRRVLQGKALVNTSQDFAAVAKTACPNINVMRVDSTAIEEVRRDLNTLWSNETPMTIPETRRFHYFSPVSSTELEASPISPSFQSTKLTQRKCWC